MPAVLRQIEQNLDHLRAEDRDVDDLNRIRAERVRMNSVYTKYKRPPYAGLTASVHVPRRSETQMQAAVAAVAKRDSAQSIFSSGRQDHSLVSSGMASSPREKPG